MTDLAKLAAPFPADEIDWRIGSTTKDKSKGMALAYIDARAVMERLDEVCGVGGWQCRYPHAESKTCCDVGIKIGDEWVWKSDGAGDTDVEGSKGAFSDAFKRAAVRWGVGRYLYDLQSPWVEIEPRGRSYVIKAADLSRLKLLAGGAKSNSKAPSEPFAPLNKTTLEAQCRKFIGELEECTDLAMLAGLQEGYKKVLKQCMEQHSNWWNNEGERLGLKQRIMKRKQEIEQAEEGIGS